MNQKKIRNIVIILSIVALAVAAAVFLNKKKMTSLGDGLYKSNGRIEAVEIYIATKYPGRLKDVLVNEGEMVKEGQVLAIMDTEVLESQLAQAEATYRQAMSQIETAKSQVHLRESERKTAMALVEQKEVELDAALKRYNRTKSLIKAQAASRQQLEDDKARLESMKVARQAAKSKVVSAEAAIQSAKSNVISVQAAAESAMAAVNRLKTEIEESSLKAPRNGRIQYRIAQPGEVISAGGRVLNLLDLTDVYMNFFLPTKEMGLLRLGQEARIVLDAAPHITIRAKISFISDEAQFTPKTVETKNERDKLMFRVRARISRELLEKHIDRVKTGLPGVVYIKSDDEAQWPDFLSKKVL